MRLLPAILLVSLTSYSVFGQTYTISTFAGGGLPVNILGTSAGFGVPTGVAVDAGGNVFMASGTYNVVLRLDAKTGILTLVAGNGTQGSSGDNGPATSAQLFNPFGVAVDSVGNLYVADVGNNLIRKVSNGVITTVAGNGPMGSNQGGFGGDNGPATSAQLSGPFGVALDSGGNLYIADTGNNRIRKVSNGMITTVAGGGSSLGDNGPATSAQLSDPIGVALDSGGNLYIADTENNRIRKVSNGMIATVAGGGSSLGDNGPATSAQLSGPFGVVLDSGGNLYIADTHNNRIRKVSNGMIATVAGNGTQGFSGDNGLATSAQLFDPNGVAVDSAGNLYIADTINLRIRKVSNGAISTVAGGSSSSGDNGPATGAQLNDPADTAVDSTGNLYIADSGNGRLRKVSNGVISTVAAGGQPNGVAVDLAGIIYIADFASSLIRKVSNGMVTTVAGNGTQGFSGDNGPATSAQLDQPNDVAVDSAGNLYIADSGNNRIRKVSNGVITTVAGSGATGFNQGGFGGDNGPATSAQLSGPLGVALDSGGNLYIADTGRIRKVSNGVITTVAGGGSSLGDNGPATSAQLIAPYRVALDSGGNLYIADTNDNRIRKVSNGVITTVAGNGTPGFSGDNGPATSAQFSYPRGVGVDSAGNVYISDTSNNRIRILTPTVTQVAPTTGCAYSISPGGQVFVAAGGDGTISVTTNPGCSWTAANSPSWVTIAGANSGTGNGTLTYQVAPNSGGDRSGSITIAGLSFTVEQASASTASFTSTSSMAQLAFAGAWTTTFTLVNTGSAPVQARLNFFDNNGNPLPVPLVFPQLGATAGPLVAATLDRTVNPGAGLVIQTAGLATQQTQVGWAQLLASGNLGGFAVFQQAIGTSIQAAVVPLENRNPAGFEIWFDNTGGNATGIALVNTGSQAATIPVVIHDDTGAILLSTTLQLRADGHSSFDMAGTYALTSGRRGTVEFDTPVGGQLSVLGISFNPTGAFSTVPALTK